MRSGSILMIGFMTILIPECEGIALVFEGGVGGFCERDAVRRWWNC